MSNYPSEFIKESISVIERNGIETIKRWANASDPMAEMFRECLLAAGR